MPIDHVWTSNVSNSTTPYHSSSFNDYGFSMSLKQNLAVKIVAGYVAFAFVFMEVFYLGVWCRPFHDYWAVPTSNGMSSPQHPRERFTVTDLHSSMYRCNESLNHQCCSQHIVRSHDYLDSNASARHFVIACEKEGNSLRCLWARRIHGKQVSTSFPLQKLYPVFGATRSPIIRLPVCTS
jgi:hypothetical protein